MLLSLVPLLALVTLARSQLTLTVSPEDEELLWKTDLTLTCTWDPVKSKGTPDVVDGEGESVFNEASKYYSEGGRVKLEEGAGFMKLTIPQLMAGDSGSKFSCTMSRVGTSQEYNVKVLEPPSVATASLTATAEFTTASISFDSVELATLYKVDYKTESASEWISQEISTTTLDLTGLEVATTYTVRVRPGNRAGYREGEELIKSTEFTTKDNRPPKPVDNLKATSAGYNITDITLTWTLDSNKGLKIAGISIKVLKNNTAVETIDLDDLTAIEETVAVGGPGVYEFIVTTSNDFSEGVETSATVSKTVKETTAPPPVPTEPPTPPPVEGLLCKKPASADYQVNTEDNAAEAEETETEGEESNTAEEISVVEATVGETVTMQCYLDTASTFHAANITWSSKMGVDLDPEAASSEEADTEAKKAAVSTFVFSSVGDNHNGVYTCKVGNETCEFQLVVQGAVEAPVDGAPSRALGPAILLLLARLL